MRCSLATVYAKIADGSLPAIRIGPGALRVTTDDLAAYLVDQNERS